MALKRFVGRLIRLSLIVLAVEAAACMGILRWLLMSPETLLHTVYVVLLILCCICAVSGLFVLSCGLRDWLRNKRKTNPI